jgi:transcriptional regulator with XRE-family HTH domain
VISPPPSPAVAGTARPAAPRRILGAALRELREDRALRLEDAATRLGVAASTLSRIETGKAPARTSYLTLLLDLYGVEDPGQRSRLADLAREGQRKSWQDDYRDILTRDREAERLAWSVTLAAALSGLSAPHRQAIVAAYYLGRTAEEAPAQLGVSPGVSPGTVKSRLHYALRTMRAQLALANARLARSLARPPPPYPTIPAGIRRTRRPNPVPFQY